MDLSSDLSEIKGVGEKTKSSLNDLGIFSVMDLLLYFPRAYENISASKLICSASENEKIQIKAKVIGINNNIRTNNNKIITSIELFDGKTVFKAKWFNQPYMKNKFNIDQEVCLMGSVKLYRNEKILMNAIIKSEQINLDNKINPIYTLKKGITNNNLNKIINEVLKNFSVSENLPNDIISKYKLSSLDEALRNIHNPANTDNLNSSIRRLKFQELFTYSLKLYMLKTYLNKNNSGISFNITESMNKIKNELPFKLTSAQNKVIREILQDEKKNISMNRLLQGDVGSGKTIVAIISMLNVITNGYQAVLMVPTEILARQHFNEASKILQNFNIKLALLTGSLSSSEKKSIKEEIKNGSVDLVIGTHAILEEDVCFYNLGMAVTDEQHRFGVMQRSKLFNKGIDIEILVMSATPIPRTLALCMYGDLDISVIDELPPKRQVIETNYIEKKDKIMAYKFALDEIKKGKQAYVVCPLVEESEEISVSSVLNTYDELKEGLFKGYNLAVLHGKMPSKEKNLIMEEFTKGKYDMLISTTVIEVGVNVPNATIMIVENAERFGLAQLHQLRGRVGRGSNKSYCILIAEIKNPVAKERMEIMKKSNDGFYISEQDLKLRGNGQVFGFKQSGSSEFILADIIEDINIFKAANFEAKALINSKNHEDYKMREEIMRSLEKSSKYICFN